MFTSQLGTADSQLGNIVFAGSPTPPVTTWYPRRKKMAVHEPLPLAELPRRRIPLAFLAGLDPVPLSWFPLANRQRRDANMPGEAITPAHHMRRSVPRSYLTSLPVPPPVIPKLSVPMVRRDPSAPRVLGGFTDLIVSVFNSLTHSGQLIQTGAGSYRIVSTSGTTELTPGPQPSVSPYFGILWVDSVGNFHYLPPNGTDIQITPLPTGGSGPDVDTGAICRIVAVGDTLTVLDTFSLIVADYFDVQGTLDLQGDATLEIT